uniref:Heterocyst differentiation protein n=1 Tax=Oscillatoriales cyanobacterium SpSt-418 TaxID=2282169 RepID=A0A7C3KBX6_9CYAN
MQPEQFTQVLEAILAGKYSWACVLILRFAGYNPLHYIPYRTYNRIVKENGAPKRPSACAQTTPKIESDSDRSQHRKLNLITDLTHLDPIAEESESAQLKGGFCFSHWFFSRS